MRLGSRPLSAIFGGARAAILDVLFSVDAALPIRRVAMLAGVAPSTAASALQALETAGIVSSEDVGRARRYRVNDGHQLAPSLRDCMERAWRTESELVELIEAELSPSRPIAIVLYGSFARGDIEPGSDIDVLIVAKNESDASRYRDRSIELSRHATVRLGRRLDVKVATARDFRRQTPFFANVASEGRSLSGLSTAELRRGA